MVIKKLEFDARVIKSAVRAIDRVLETRDSKQLEEWRHFILTSDDQLQMPIVMRNIVRALKEYESEMADVLYIEVENCIIEEYWSFVGRYEFVILPLLRKLNDIAPDDKVVRMMIEFYADPSSIFASEEMFKDLMKLKEELRG